MKDSYCKQLIMDAEAGLVEAIISEIDNYNEPPFDGAISTKTVKNIIRKVHRQKKF